jgi:hypothetical protein
MPKKLHSNEKKRSRRHPETFGQEELSGYAFAKMYNSPARNRKIITDC